MRFIFTSDLHGNIEQYSKLFQKADEYSIDTVIIGGDIAPHGSPEDQRRFFENHMVPFFEEMQKKKKYRILLIFGNDDWMSNVDMMAKFDGKLFFLIDKKKVEINGINFIGYTNVPVTPFRLKDWEKWDDETLAKRRIRLDGFKSKGDTIVPVILDENDYTDTIEKDLKKIKKLSDPKKTIYIFHSPPSDTSIDITGSGEHVGSTAIRKFIEENEPLATLHGHIHETVDVSGKFMDKIGKTPCISSGNHPHGNRFSFVLVDTENIGDVKRESTSF